MRSAITAALTLGLSALFAVAAPDARANGRFPQSNAIFFAPNDPNVVLLRTTFGELLSHDHGETFDWICERSIGLAGADDPMYAITPDGTLVASTFQGLAISHDRACNFAFAGGPVKDLVFIDVTSRPSTPGTIIAFASSYAGQDDAGAIFFKSTLFETKDEGKTFAQLGTSFDPALIGETVDTTPSDPDRIYVSAVRNVGTPAASGALLTSRDHGATFEENPFALTTGERGAYIAAVDPANADRLYVRTSSGTDLPSRLLLSEDAGKSFRTIFTGTGPLAGFALSADGKRIYVGGPKDGLVAASTTDFQWEKKSTVEVGCLKWNADGLWACSGEKSGFVLGLSKDEGATFKPLLHFCDIRGPLACAAGSTTNVECALGGTGASRTPPWPSQRAALGCDGPGTRDAGPVDAAHDSAAGGGTEPMDGGGGCSLRTPAPSPLAGLLVGAAATLALLRRRRR